MNLGELAVAATKAFPTKVPLRTFANIVPNEGNVPTIAVPSVKTPLEGLLPPMVQPAKSPVSNPGFVSKLTGVPWARPVIPPIGITKDKSNMARNIRQEILLFILRPFFLTVV